MFLVGIARIRVELDRLEQRILRRRNRADFQAERWWWLTTLAALDASDELESHCIEAIAPDGTVTSKRIRPRWYWTQVNARKRLDPTYRERERLRSRLRRQRAAASQSPRGSSHEPLLDLLSGA